MAANTSHSANHTITRYSSKQIFIVVSIMIIALILDTSIIRISDLTLKSTSSWVLGLFAILSGISLVGQNIILRFIKQKFGESTPAQKSFRLYSIYKVAVTVHYVLAAIVVFVILQMVITSQYDVVLLIAATMTSYVLAIAMLGLLCHGFFSWFRLNKSYVILLYGLSSMMLAANAAITLWLTNSVLLARPEEVMPHVVLNNPIYNADPVNSALNYAYTISTITSFIITWCATMALLKNYIQKIGKLWYWIALILPLGYFVSQFLVLSLGLLPSMIMSDPIFYGILFTLIFTLSKPIGGIIFGIAFWMIARNIHKDNVVRSYLIISAYGFLLLFTSNQAIVLTFTPYPPFGLVTISFVGLGSFLVLVGIYSSAISISQDANLRREIRHLAIKESKLLESIGLAQIENELRNRVLHMAALSTSDAAESGVPSTLEEEDVSRYLDDVLKEIDASKKKGSLKNENP
jgi:hypothetical protein